MDIQIWQLVFTLGQFKKSKQFLIKKPKPPFVFFQSFE